MKRISTVIISWLAQEVGGICMVRRQGDVACAPRRFRRGEGAAAASIPPAPRSDTERILCFDRGPTLEGLNWEQVELSS